MKKGEDYIATGVVYYCHDGEGNFVMSKRSTNCRDEHGTWDPGGGGIELHDTVENTLRKEIKEEYCTDVIKYEFLGYRDVHRENKASKTHWIMLDFKVLVDKEKVGNGEPHKFTEVGWFTLHTLPSPLHSQFPNFIRLYEEKLRR